MELSILIRSLYTRMSNLFSLLDTLYNQVNEEEAWDKVEILFDMDNKQVSSGFKANRLLKRAAGKYVVFIDDDDMIAPYYVREMLKGCKSGADCMAINGWYIKDDAKPVRWELSKDNSNVTISKPPFGRVLLRKTNHITAVKREIALKAGFPDVSNAEDKAYSEALVLNTEFKIEPPMYWYQFSSKNKQY